MMLRFISIVIAVSGLLVAGCGGEPVAVAPVATVELPPTPSPVPPAAPAPVVTPRPSPTLPPARVQAEPRVTPSPEPAARSQPPRYTVVAGDTVHAVADRFGTTATALVVTNGLRGSRLAPGQEIEIADAGLLPPVPPPGPVASAVTVSAGPGTRRAVALTFDAGADRGYAEMILDTLKARGVRASFGMTGVWARDNADLVRRMAAEGHRLMNHTWDHASWTGVSPRTRPLTSEQRAVQVERTEALILDLTGISTRPFFRSPYGDQDASVQRDIAARGYAYNMLWTCDSLGWTGATVRAIVDRCVRAARPGAIILLHVGAQALDGPALAPLIDALAAQGYDFETVEEIIEP